MTVVEKRGKLSIQLSKPSGNLKSHASWLEFLTGGEFYPAIKGRFEQKGRVDKVQSGVRKVIRSEVYQPYSPRKYTRTFNLLNSYMAEAGSGKSAEIIAFSNVQTAPAIAGASKGQFSYAAFFEERYQKPSEDGGTFIRADAMPFRPHFQLLVLFISDFLPAQAHDAVVKTIRSRLPKTQEVK